MSLKNFKILRKSPALDFSETKVKGQFFEKLAQYQWMCCFSLIATLFSMSIMVNLVGFFEIFKSEFRSINPYLKNAEIEFKKKIKKISA